MRRVLMIACAAAFIAVPATSKADPLETFHALDEACRGGEPGISTDRACKARDDLHIERMGYCYQDNGFGYNSFWRKGKALANGKCRS
jgi:hypothetical protein